MGRCKLSLYPRDKVALLTVQMYGWEQHDPLPFAPWAGVGCSQGCVPSVESQRWQWHLSTWLNFLLFFSAMESQERRSGEQIHLYCKSAFPSLAEGDSQSFMSDTRCAGEAGNGPVGFS